MAELKKCPFCGGEAFLYQSGSTSCGFFGEVICKKCGVRTERVNKNLAIKVWNNRATESEIRAKAIDEFAEKLKAELSEQIFSDEEKFKYARKEQELICAQNMTWKMAIKVADMVAEQLKGE